MPENPIGCTAGLAVRAAARTVVTANGSKVDRAPTVDVSRRIADTTVTTKPKVVVRFEVVDVLWSRTFGCTHCVVRDCPTRPSRAPPEHTQ